MLPGWLFEATRVTSFMKSRGLLGSNENRSKKTKNNKHNNNTNITNPLERS